jgi:hypothetical protein
MPHSPPATVSSLTEDLLEEVKRRVVDAFAPERVILFGSYAEARATADSDVDLLVVTRRPVSYQERLAHTQAIDFRRAGQAAPLGRSGLVARWNAAIPPTTGGSW